ncbi:hypothetical protein [Bacillus phage BvP]
MKNLHRIQLAHTGMLLIIFTFVHLIYYCFAGEVWANGIQYSLVCTFVAYVSIGKGLRDGYVEGVKEGRSHKKINYWRSKD